MRPGGVGASVPLADITVDLGPYKSGSDETSGGSDTWWDMECRLLTPDDAWKEERWACRCRIGGLVLWRSRERFSV